MITRLCPTTPGNTQRYLPPSDLISIYHTSISTATPSAPCRTKPSEGGWTRYVHPEGKPYFHDSTKEIATVTEENLSDEAVLHKVELAYQLVYDRIAKISLAVSSLSQLELLLELDRVSKDTCNYFFVDHASRSLLWLEPVTTESLNLHQICSSEHLGSQLLREYWTHIEHFPNHITLDSTTETNLLETLSWSSLDYMTCETSTSAYSASKIVQFISLLKSCPEGLKTWVIARISAIFVNHQFFNYHGLIGARLERTISVESNGAKHQPDLLMKILFLLLFNAPASHLQKLNKLWVDQILYAEQWEIFMSDLLRHWNDTSLLATVLLAGNMMFLAITPDQVHATGASAISTSLALGSILTSSVSERQQRHRLRSPTTHSCAFLERNHHLTLGFQLIAIIFALPYSLMLWSVVALVAGILLQSLEGVDLPWTTKVMITGVAVIVTLLCIVTFIFMALDDQQLECSWSSWWKQRWVWNLGSRERHSKDVEEQKHS